MVSRCSCGGDTKVIDTRDRGNAIIRRRECIKCQKRYNTMETPVIKELLPSAIEDLYVELDNITSSIKVCLDTLQAAQGGNDNE